MFACDSYLDAFYPKPEDGISVEQKRNEPSYSLGVAKYIYSQGLKDRFGVYAKRLIYERNRQYGRGVQSTVPYQDKLDPLEPVYARVQTQDGEQLIDTGRRERKGYSHINYVVYPIMPKFRTHFIGKMINAKHDINVRALDIMTQQIKIDNKKKMWANKVLAQNSDFFADFLQNNEPEIAALLPSSKDELDMIYAGERLDYETAMELCVTNDIRQSQIDDINIKWYEDIFDFNEVAGMLLLDKNVYQQRIAYIDPAELIIEHSKYRDYRDSSYAGIFMNYTIADFRKENPHLSEDEIRKFVSMYATKYGNNFTQQYMFTPYSSQNDRVTDGKVYGYWNYDNVVIPVLKCYWITIDSEADDTEVEVKAKVRQSELQSGKIYERDGKFYKKVKSKIPRVSVQMCYECKWVIDSDYVWDYGASEYQIRNNREVMLPVFKVRGDGLSINERLQACVDDIHIAYYKFQNAQAFAANNGYVFNWSSLVATAEKIDGLLPQDILTIRHAGSGDIVMEFNTNSPFETITRQGINGLPIQPLQGGLQNLLDEYIRLFAQKMYEMQLLSGISSENLALRERGDDTAEQARMRSMATSESMYLSYKVNNQLCVRIFYAMALRLQKLLYLSDKCFESYSKICGAQLCDAIRSLEKRNDSFIEWGIDIIDQVSEDEKRNLEEMLNISLNSGRNGQPQITTSDYFLVRHVLKNSGNYKLARQVLLIRERYRIEQAQKHQEEMLKLQQEGVIKQKQEEARLAEESARAEHERKKELIILEADLELRNQQQAHNNNMQIKSIPQKQTAISYEDTEMV